MSIVYFKDDFIEDTSSLPKAIGAAAALAKRLNSQLFINRQINPDWQPTRKIFYFAGEDGLVRPYVASNISLIPDMADAIVFWDGVKWRFTAVQRIKPRLVVDNKYGHYEFDIQVDSKNKTVKFSLHHKEASYSDTISRSCQVINTNMTSHNPYSFAVRRVWKWSGTPPLYITTIDIFYHKQVKTKYELPENAEWIGHSQITISKGSSEDDWDQIHFNVADPTSIPQGLPRNKDCYWVEDDFTKYLVTPFGVYAAGASECPNTLFALNANGKCIVKQFWRKLDDNGYWLMADKEWVTDSYNQEVQTGTAHTEDGDFVDDLPCLTIPRDQLSCEECSQCKPGKQYIFYCLFDEYLSYTCWNNSRDPYWNQIGEGPTKCYGKTFLENVASCVWGDCMMLTGPDPPLMPWCLGSYYEHGGVIDFCSFSNPTVEADHSYWQISYIGAPCEAIYKYEHRHANILKAPSFGLPINANPYNPSYGQTGDVGWSNDLAVSGAGGAYSDIDEYLIFKENAGVLHNVSLNRCLSGCWTQNDGCDLGPCCNSCPISVTLSSCYSDDECCSYGGGPFDTYYAQWHHILNGILPDFSPIYGQNRVFDFYKTRDYLDSKTDSTPHRNNSTYSNCEGHACPNATEANIAFDNTCEAVCWDRFPDFTCEDWNNCRDTGDPEVSYCNVSHDSHDRIEGHFFYKGKAVLEGEGIDAPLCMAYAQTVDMGAALIEDKFYFFADKEFEYRADIKGTIQQIIEDHEGFSIDWIQANTMVYFTRG